MSATPVWQSLGPLQGISTEQNYTPLLFTPKGMEVFSNSCSGQPDGMLYRYGVGGEIQRSWWGKLTAWFTKLLGNAVAQYGVGAGRPVLALNDPANKYIRTIAVARGDSGKYYGALYTGDAYPGTNGYLPSWAWSADGERWVWEGVIMPELGRYQSAGCSLLVDELRNDAYRFMLYADNVQGVPLTLFHSGDGVNWNKVTIALPAEVQADGDPNFPNAVRTPYGVHLIYSKDWPATAHRHLFSANGVDGWKVLEMNAGSFYPGAPKSTNMAYNALTQEVLALTSGKLFSFKAEAF